MTEKRAYRQYPREFKEEAVALITDQGYSVQKAADSLGIRSNLLYRWQRQLEDQKSGKSLSTEFYFFLPDDASYQGCYPVSVR